MQLFKKKRLQALISKDPKKRARAAKEFLQEGEAGAEILLAAFEEPNTQLHKIAFQILLKMNQSALPALEKGIFSDSPPIQNASAEALSKIGTESALDILIRALKRGTPRQQSLAAGALGATKNEAVVPHLLVALTASDPLVRIAAIGALGEMNAPDAAKYIADLLRDSEIEVRIAAAKMLETLRDPDALPELVDSLHDSFWWYGRDTETDALLHAIASFGAAAKESLLDAMKDREANVRRYAIRLLAKLNDPSLLDAFEMAFYDTNYDVAATALEALLTFGSAALPVLFRACESPHEWIRQKAAYGLGTLSGDDAFVRLLEMLDDPSPDVRKEVIRALAARRDSRALPALNAVAAGRSDREISKLARQAIAEIRARDVL